MNKQADNNLDLMEDKVSFFMFNIIRKEIIWSTKNDSKHYNLNKFHSLIKKIISSYFD